MLNTRTVEQQVAPIVDAQCTTSHSLGVFSALVWFSIVYAPVTVLLASRKQLWNDELFTFYIAKLGSMQRIWDALPVAGDQNPPLFYWFSHVCASIWPDSLLWIRLPEIAGFWLAGACLIAFVSRRLSPLYGLIAALMTLVSGAYPYAYEARPYGLMLGLAAVALMCWQRIGSARTSIWAAGLALSLALALSVHYYSVLIFLPLAVAEVLTWSADGRPRWIVWAALAAGALPLAAYLPLIRSARTFSHTFWARPQAGSIADFYGFLILPALLPISAAVFCACAWLFIRGRLRAAGITRIRMPLAETAAVTVFSALPVIAVIGGLVVTGAYTHRYALPAAIGCSILGAWAMAAVFRPLPGAALIIALVLSLVFAAKQFRTLPGNTAIANHQTLIPLLERRVADGYDLAIADPHLFFELSHQAPGLRPHMLYIAEPDLALRYVGTDAVDRSLLGISAFAPLQMRTLAQVAAARTPLLIYGYPAPNGWAWIVQELASLHVPISVAGIVNGRLMFLVNDFGPLGGRAVPERDPSR